MEYCDRPECAGLHGKRKVHTPGMLLAAAVFAAALCKLPDIKIPEPAPLHHSAYVRAAYGSQIQKRPKIPVMPNMPVNLLDRLPAVPSTPALPDMTAIPSFPVLPDMPAGPSASVLPDMSAGPSVLLLPDMQELPPCPALPDKPAGPETQFLSVPAIPKEPFLPDMPVVPKDPAFPGTPSVPEGQILPGAPSVPVPPMPENGGILPSPECPVIPNIPQSPEVQQPPSEMPSIPDDSGSTVLPPENIVPDAPPEVVPDNPAGQEKPNDPGGENPVQDELMGFRVDQEGMICGYDPSAGLASEGMLTLPCEGCTGIARGAFEGTGAGIYELYIPSNITYIEPGALTPLSDLGWIGLKGANPSYKCFEGVLFDSTLSALVFFPAARTGQYGMPGFTSKLEDYSFFGTQLSKLDMRDCGLVEVGKNTFGDTGARGVSVAAPRQYMEEYKAAFAGTGVLVK